MLATSKQDVRTNFAAMASDAQVPPELSSFLLGVDPPGRILRLPKEECLYKQGDTADSVFYILRGMIALRLSSDDGNKGIVAVGDAGEFWGVRCLAGELRRVATAEALTDCQAIQIEKTAIFQALRQQPEFSRMFVKYILVRNARAEEDLVDQIFNSVEKRLARALLMLARLRKKGGPMPARISHETFAELIGTTRSQVTFFMNKFRRLGFIDYGGDDLEVHDSLLSVLSKGDRAPRITFGLGALDLAAGRHLL